MFSRTSLTTQFAFVFAVALALIATASYLILDRIYLGQLQSQAETVADNVDAFGDWVAQYGRVWVRDNDKSYLGHSVLYATDDPGAVPPTLVPVHYYSKNPALAQREYSEVVEHSASPAKFRMTSHNVMNPANKPDAFEERALAAIRGGRLTEYHELTSGGYRYARTLIHKASCIACHGDPARAPVDVKVRYGTQNGFGFKEGDVAGIISVRLPVESFASVAFRVVGPGPLAMIVAGFVLAMLYMRLAVVGRVRALTAATRRISLGKDADLGTVHVQSRNELDQLALATERLRVSINMAMKRLKRDARK